jgi:hypothetical protein
MVRKLNETGAATSDQRLADAAQRLRRLPVLSATVRRVQLIAESEDAGIGDMVAALEAVRGGKGGAAMASPVAEQGAPGARRRPDRRAQIAATGWRRSAARSPTRNPAAS